MGGLNPPVPQQDNNWEIRVAVLLSLLFQVLIVFLGPLRRRSSSPVARGAIWSSYLLADWVADLALGLLLNNMGNIGGSNSSSLDCSSNYSSPIIFAFWTPFLLVHLGGQDCLTALSIQDNNLWLRNLTSLGFQLFTACVIFFLSLQGNPMVPATVLIFIVGIIKYGERIYSLYSSSVDGALAEIIGVPDPGTNYEKFMALFDSNESAGLPVEIIVHDIQAQREHLRYVSMMQVENISIEALAYKFFCIFRQLCFDIKPSYKERMISQEYFLGRAGSMEVSPAKAYEIIELELNFMYDMVHTKEPIAHTTAGCIFRFIASTCLVSSFLIFLFHGDKGGITHVDIAITYALLLGGMAIDAAALAMLLISNWTMVFLEKTQRLRWLARVARSFRPRLRLRRWKEDTSQMNLISYCLGIPQPEGFVRTFAMLANKLHMGEICHDVLYIRREPLSSSAILGDSDFLFKFVFEAAKKTTNMDKMSLYRGEGVLQDKRLYMDMEIKNYLMQNSLGTKEAAWEEKNDRAKEKLDVLLDSVRREFSESLLMWHIATDLCGYPLIMAPLTKEATRMRLIAETLSGYMLYLLIKQPKILLASAGIGLKQYKDTCAEAKRFFETAAAWRPYHSDARRMLLTVNTSTDPSAVKGYQSKSVLFDGVIVAKVLRDLHPDLMWEVLAGVWGEMLTYAAGKCSGSTHVEQLSRGGELITVVWFLMAHMDCSGTQKNELAAKLIVNK